MPVKIVNRNRGGRLDWISVRNLFISRNLERIGKERYSLKDLASDIKVTYGTVRNHASREGWDKLLEKALEDQEKALRKRMEQSRKEVTHSLQKDELNKEINVRQRQASAARMLQSKAAKKLTNLNSSDLSVRDAIELMKIGLIEERKALGLADRYEVTTKGEAPPPEHLSTSKARAVLGRIIDLVEKKAGVYEEAPSGIGG